MAAGSFFIYYPCSDYINYHHLYYLSLLLTYYINLSSLAYMDGSFSNYIHTSEYIEIIFEPSNGNIYIIKASRVILLGFKCFGGL